MSRKLKDNNIFLMYGDEHGRRIKAERFGSLGVAVQHSTPGPPSLTLDQWERFAHKILAMCADVRKAKQ